MNDNTSAFDILCYAVIPLPKKKVEVSAFDTSNLLFDNSTIVHIGKEKASNCHITGSGGLIVISNEVASDSFLKRLKFCFKYLFRYK